MLFLFMCSLVLCLLSICCIGIVVIVDFVVERSCGVVEKYVVFFGLFILFLIMSILFGWIKWNGL